MTGMSAAGGRAAIESLGLNLLEVRKIRPGPTGSREIW